MKGKGRVCLSTGTDNLQEAENFLAKIIDEIRQVTVYGARPKRTFREAATKYLQETEKRSLARDAYCLKNLDPFIGDMDIMHVHMGTLMPYIEARKAAGIKSKTIGRDLAVLRRILTLAARSWRDEQNKPWIDIPPLLAMPNWEDGAEPYPLNWQEQARFFDLLPEHLRVMALFKVNTGLREQGVCWLRRDWEVKVSELNTSIFITPGKRIEYEDGIWRGEKNKEDQIVVLNQVARGIIEQQRGLHPIYVFPYEGRRIGAIHTTAWKNAWRKAGLPVDGSHNKGPHNLKHTFGRRLRSAGVPLETRKVLLHHKSGDITTHYSGAELRELIAAVESICEADAGIPITLLRRGTKAK
nr:tyrosine-type recombinase/integrase [Methylomonas sp. MK1]